MTHTDKTKPLARGEAHHVEREGARVRFTFEGRELAGRAGESIACALFRNGVRTLSYSVKYHRPRGILCGRGRCVGCLMEVDGDPSVKTCVTELRAGMDIRRQDFRPFYAPLLTASIRLLPFPAGFYFRFFSRPRFVRRAFLGTLRRMAGVARVDVERSGKAPAGVAGEPVLGRVAGRYDVIVVGAGRSGLTAARSAAAAGAEVLLVEEETFLGGSGAGEDTTVQAAAAVERNARVTVVAGCAAQGYYGDGRILISGRGRLGFALREVRAPAVVLATGGTDVIPLFENNDMPGVLGVRALRLFLERDGLIPGRDAVVFGTGAELVEAVNLLRRHQIGLRAIVDTSEAPEAVATHSGARLLRAEGGEWISEVSLNAASGVVRFPCDLLCIAGVPQPAFELSQQVGFAFKLTSDAIEANRVMTPVTEALTDGECNVYLVGTSAGIRDDALAHAEAVGRRAAGGG